MKRGFLDLLDPSNDPDFFWQVISGPPCIFIYSYYIYPKLVHLHLVPVEDFQLTLFFQNNKKNRLMDLHYILNFI
jgi:hypothetical protein